MNKSDIERIFRDTAYIRTGGSAEEEICARYLIAQCSALGLEAHEETFEVPMGKNITARLIAGGEETECRGYMCAGSGEVEAELYYLRSADPFSLSQCRGKIVMIDTYLGYWIYQDLIENGAVGFITFDGNANYADRDIDARELRSYVSKGNVIPGININAKSAISIIERGIDRVRIELAQEEYTGQSRNVVLDIPGKNGKCIVMTAHYDSTSLSQGAYDNMSGCVGLLAAAEKFAAGGFNYGLRLIWCGSEERGLLGSKAYCAAHEQKLDDIAMVINLDMIGSIMGRFIACCTSEDKLVHFIEYLGRTNGFSLRASQDVYSSDSTPFADKGIPAVSFARLAPPNTATIHNSYDTVSVMSSAQMEADIEFILSFTQTMLSAALCPVERKMPDNMKEKLDIYLCRKRDKK